MTGEPMSVQDAFFAYAKGKIGLSPKMLSDYLQRASDYCHLKQPLLGMSDVIAVRKVQQKVAEGKLLRFRFGKDAQTIRNVTQLYYNFVKSYREMKDQPDGPKEMPSAIPSEELNSRINDADSIALVQATEEPVPVSDAVKIPLPTQTMKKTHLTSFGLILQRMVLSLSQSQIIIFIRDKTTR